MPERSALLRPAGAKQRTCLSAGAGNFFLWQSSGHLRKQPEHMCGEKKPINELQPRCGKAGRASAGSHTTSEEESPSSTSQQEETGASSSKADEASAAAGGNSDTGEAFRWFPGILPGDICSGLNSRQACEVCDAKIAKFDMATYRACNGYRCFRCNLAYCRACAVPPSPVHFLACALCIKEDAVDVHLQDHNWTGRADIDSSD